MCPHHLPVVDLKELIAELEAKKAQDKEKRQKGRKKIFELTLKVQEELTKAQTQRIVYMDQVRSPSSPRANSSPRQSTQQSVPKSNKEEKEQEEEKVKVGKEEEEEAKEDTVEREGEEVDEALRQEAIMAVRRQEQEAADR